MVSRILGPKFWNNYSFLPVDDTSVGILISVSKDHFQLLSSGHSKYSLSVRIQALQDTSEWTLSSVYGPQQESDNIIFLGRSQISTEGHPGGAVAMRRF
jgi:hypothetical protein